MVAASSSYRAKHASNSRLDVVTMMVHEKTAGSVEWPARSYPCIISPLDDGLKGRRKPRPNIFVPVTSVTISPKLQQNYAPAKDAGANCHGAIQTSRKPLPQIPSQPSKASTTLPPTSASSPRSATPTKRRPASLSLRNTNGCTGLPSPELKQRICDTRINDIAAIVQIPVDNREQLPPTPTTPLSVLAMGNAHSSHPADSVPDDKSLRSVVHIRRSSKPISRKSSFNVFKRIDSRSPLPRDVTTSVMSILHRDAHGKDESCPDSDGLVSVPTDPFFDQPEEYDGQYPRSPKVHSASTITMTESRAHLPLSASTTIRDFTSNEASEDSLKDDAPRINLPESSGDDVDILSTISPTIPAPSPLPEDSPHKYGLRDQIDTPEVPEVPEGIEMPKARRKSSGPELFNEAKNLQSASSFLNGLSTARRRAESEAALHNTESTDGSWEKVTGASAGTSRPPSTRPPSRPSTAYQDVEGRRRGHNFKSSGFAYTRPLTINQIKCYRGHSRLLLSRNKHAPVECAVCHIDDDAEHFSCSWCALRMCKFCRKDLAERGLSALRERIKIAELGGRADSAHSSSSNEDLEELAKITSAYT